MNILNTIIEYKKSEVRELKSQHKIAALEKSSFFLRTPFSLQKSLFDRSKTGIIAEFKRSSPSKGVINDKADVQQVTSDYVKYGASGLSVLTDNKFFSGSAEDLQKARVNEIPILRKDFIIDEYQVVETKSMGAEVILLIAACLSRAEVKSLSYIAKNIGLEVLLEIHDEQEIEHICDTIDFVGVNNRNLKTFVVDLEQSVRLSQQIGTAKIKIAESGIHEVNHISYLKQHGFDGFLIGENFMKHADPGKAFATFVQELNQLQA